VRDPFGHEWLLGGHLETVTPEEMQRDIPHCSMSSASNVGWNGKT